MDPTLTPILLTLLPTDPSPSSLPPQLHDLARALHAQSRSAAPSLKPTEEPARAWACADIAIQRLKQRLDLPATSAAAQPPVPPKVYRQLRGYLDSALSVGTPRKRREEGASAAGVKSTAVTSAKSTAATGGKSTAVTPAKRAAAAVVERPKGAAGPTQRKPGKEEAPAWVMPTVRQLCGKLGAKDAAGHVYVGVVSVAGAAGRKGADEETLPAVIVAVLVFVLERLTGESVEVKAVRTALEELVALKRVTLRRFGEVLAETQRLLRDEKERWMRMEWVRNIPGYEDDEMDDDGQGDDGDEGGGLNARKRKMAGNHHETLATSSRGGLGTMMQDRIDWLSDERRADFVRWKAEMMQKIKEVEQQQRQKTPAAA